MECSLQARLQRGKSGGSIAELRAVDTETLRIHRHYLPAISKIAEVHNVRAMP